MVFQIKHFTSSLDHFRLGAAFKPQRDAHQLQILAQYRAIARHPYDRTERLVGRDARRRQAAKSNSPGILPFAAEFENVFGDDLRLDDFHRCFEWAEGLLPPTAGAGASNPETFQPPAE